MKKMEWLFNVLLGYYEVSLKFYIYFPFFVEMDFDAISILKIFKTTSSKNEFCPIKFLGAKLLYKRLCLSVCLSSVWTRLALYT